MGKVPAVVAWFLIIHIMTIGIYDAWAMMYRGRIYTISFALMAIAKEFPIVPCLLGIVVGHLFFPQQPASQIVNGAQEMITPAVQDRSHFRQGDEPDTAAQHMRERHNG